MTTEESDLNKLDWSNILDLTARAGTTWKFVEAGCQWRNGLVERQVAALKRTLKVTLDMSPNLNIAEINTLFSTAAFLVNQRPLGVASQGQEDPRSITPNDLLLGRNKVPVKPGNQFGDSDDIPVRLQFMEDLSTLW